MPLNRGITEKHVGIIPFLRLTHVTVLVRGMIFFKTSQVFHKRPVMEIITPLEGNIIITLPCM